jgi:LmbE family N-acetylglucosaminyl deacetylase
VFVQRSVKGVYVTRLREHTTDVARTVVSFHAHPDDESMLTGGTLAGLAAAGDRVVLVTATAGEAGLTGAACSRTDLATRRLSELNEAATCLGVARVVCLGYADSGYHTTPPADAFSRVPIGDAAARLAAVLDEEGAEVLTVYDEHGGYGHPDHQHVYDVGLAAAKLAGTPRVMQATIDRDRMLRLSRSLQLVPGLPPELRVGTVRGSYSPRSALTHCIDVSAQLDAKRAAMSAHRSQRSGGRRPRSLDVYLRLPFPIFARLFGREWFIENGRTPHTLLATDFWSGS